jgi:hypothetical protein
MQILHFPPTAYFLLPRLLARIGSLIYGEPIGLSRGLRESDVGQSRPFDPPPTTSGLTLETDILRARPHVSKVSTGDKGSPA